MPGLCHCLILVLALLGGLADRSLGGTPTSETIRQIEPKMVKVYGAGGSRGLEPYQSGLLVSPEGHVLTVFSYVLDTEEVTVTLHDGRKHRAELLGADPRLEVAVLKIDAAGLPFFDLDEAVEVKGGTRVLAFSNLFGVATGDEPVSVQHGVVSVRTTLEARRGAFETPYHGPVYVLDAVTNNPGAAGGAVVTYRGQLVGMLGKELRNSQNATWLNYALPIDEVRPSVGQIRAGKFVARSPDESAGKPDRPLDLSMLGIVLVPKVLPQTPPYVDLVRADSAAASAGLRADDLVLFVNGRLVRSCKALRAELEYVDWEDPVRLTVLRGHKVVELVLQTRGKGNP